MGQPRPFDRLEKSFSVSMDLINVCRRVASMTARLGTDSVLKAALMKTFESITTLI
jgi:hypothetical protein